MKIQVKVVDTASRKFLVFLVDSKRWENRGRGYSRFSWMTEAQERRFELYFDKHNPYFNRYSSSCKVYTKLQPEFFEWQ